MSRATIGKIAHRAAVAPRSLMVFGLGLLTPTPMGAAHAPDPSAVTEAAAEALYREVGLAGILEGSVFEGGYGRMEQHGLHARMLAMKLSQA